MVIAPFVTSKAFLAAAQPQRKEPSGGFAKANKKNLEAYVMLIRLRHRMRIAVASIKFTQMAL
jgi:hypothetical protein